MVIIREGGFPPLASPVLRSMFEARKRVFVDLLKWDVPVVDNRFEVDQFDDEHATYLIAADPDGGHAGSARLLETVRPHILDTLFPDLCAREVPRGRGIFEVTRFCLDRRLGAGARLATRNLLVSALVDYALDRGIQSYTGIAELGWLQQILAFGWRCRPLGIPRTCGGRLIGAFQIDIESSTPALLAGNGLYRPVAFNACAALEAA